MMSGMPDWPHAANPAEPGVPGPFNGSVNTDAVTAATRAARRSVARSVPAGRQPGGQLGPYGPITMRPPPSESD
eukprot:767665-Hanusia_phi.AAC.1